jgi:hypothetical protein
MALPRRRRRRWPRRPADHFPAAVSGSPFDVKIYAHQRSGKREATRWLISLLQTLGNVAAAPAP